MTELGLPAYICQGRYDYTTNHELARAYCERLRAPAKGFYTFERSAHSPAFEEPARFHEVLREDVLSGATRLADPTPEARAPARAEEAEFSARSPRGTSLTPQMRR